MHALMSSCSAVYNSSVSACVMDLGPRSTSADGTAATARCLSRETPYIAHDVSTANATTTNAPASAQPRVLSLVISLATPRQRRRQHGQGTVKRGPASDRLQ